MITPMVKTITAMVFIKKIHSSITTTVLKINLQTTPTRIKERIITLNTKGNRRKLKIQLKIRAEEFKRTRFQFIIIFSFSFSCSHFNGLYINFTA